MSILYASMEIVRCAEGSIIASTTIELSIEKRSSILVEYFE